MQPKIVARRNIQNARDFARVCASKRHTRSRPKGRKSRVQQSNRDMRRRRRRQWRQTAKIGRMSAGAAAAAAAVAAATTIGANASGQSKVCWLEVAASKLSIRQKNAAAFHFCTRVAMVAGLPSGRAAGGEQASERRREKCGRKFFRRQQTRSGARATSRRSSRAIGDRLIVLCTVDTRCTLKMWPKWRTLRRERIAALAYNIEVCSLARV